MKELELCSGPWVGFWVHSGDKGNMKMHLSIANGSISGMGTDRVGPFVLDGTIDRYLGRVLLVKKYGSHSLTYKGSWNGSMLSGMWSGGPWHNGTFEMWPELDEMNVSDILFNEAFG